MTDKQHPDTEDEPVEPCQLVVERGDLWELWWRAFEARTEDGE